jgi:hypothetical protein
MKLTSLLTILISIVASIVYFSHPIATGSELFISQDLFLPLPQNNTRDLIFPAGEVLDSDQVIPIRTADNIGAFLLDHGLLRWFEQEDFAAVNQQWITSYSYLNPSPNVYSTISERVIESNPGWFPFLIPNWIGEMEQNGNSIRFGQNYLTPDRFRTWSWASIITSIDGNGFYLAVGLADGRIVIFPGGIGDWEPPIFLMPDDSWFLDGSLAQRIPISLRFVNNFLVSIYGSQEPRAVIWDARAWTVIQQFNLPDLLSINNIEIQGIENNQGQLLLDFFDGKHSIQVRFSPIEGTVQRNQSWGRLMGYLTHHNLSLHQTRNVNSTKSIFHLYRANDSGSRVLQTVAFDGAMTTHEMGVLWFGQDVYGQVSFHWSGIQSDQEEWIR